MAVYDELHREIPDPTPVALPMGYEKPETLAQIMSRIIAQNQHLEKMRELETEEEADDFNVEDEDDIEFTSAHEFMDMNEEFVVERVEKLKDDPHDTKGDLPSDPKRPEYGGSDGGELPKEPLGKNPKAQSSGSVDN